MSGRAYATLALALLLAGCGARTGRGPALSPAPGAGLVAGTWIPIAAPDDRDRRACAGDVGIRFHADGRYEMLEEAGRWRIDGDRLTMTPQAGRATVARIGRTGPAIVLTYADGHRETMARCP